MLTRAKKEALVESMHADFDKAHGLFLTNLIGVPSNDSVAIRKEIREANGKVIVAKNTLLKKAAEGTDAEKLVTDLKGPNAIAIAFEDAPAVAKALKNAGKEHEAVEFKGGFLNGEELTVEQIKEIADLPSREEMLATVLATLNAPVSAFARLLDQIREKKDSGESLEPTAEETTEGQSE